MRTLLLVPLCYVIALVLCATRETSCRRIFRQAHRRFLAYLAAAALAALCLLAVDRWL